MKRISAGSTFLVKRVFPVAYIGFLALFLLQVSIAVPEHPSDMIPFVAIPLVLLAVGVSLFRKFVWDLADEVHDAGDVLLVRKNGIEERVRLDNVMNVSVAMMANPPRVTLRLATPGRLGREISFIPLTAFRFNPFARIEVAEDLIERVDAARRQPATRD